MHIPSLLFVAAVSMRVAYADFLVITEAPIPTSLIPSFTRIDEATAWTTNVFFNFKQAWPRTQSSLGDPYFRNSSSAQSAVSSFFAAHTNYSIPTHVTNPSQTATFTGPKPDWYDALPTSVRQFKEQEVKWQESVLREVITSLDGSGGSGGAQKTGKSTGAAAPTAAFDKARWAVAAGAAAMFL